MQDHQDEPAASSAVASLPRWKWRPGTNKSAAPRQRPWLTVGALAAIGFLLYNKWLTIASVTSGDWLWEAPTRLRQWFPWPSVWEPGIGFGLKNFGQSFEFPIFALAGLLNQANVPWGTIEKVLYFWPIAALSLVSPWLLGREILGSSRWALMTALLFAGNTYIVTESTVGHTFIAVADVLAPLVLLAFLRTLRRSSLRWAFFSGLLLALQAAYDFRIMYLTLGMAMGLLVVVLLRERLLDLVVRRLMLFLASVVVFLACGVYWWLPLLAYHGDFGLNLPASPWIAFMQLSHGVAAVEPFWTWKAPSWFLAAPVNPLFLVVPALAFIPLLRRRIRSEILWLSICALAGALLINQQNPPLGGVYEWMFAHLPGWNMFREASKLFVVVVIAYSVLVPEAFRILFASGFATRLRLARPLATSAVIGAVIPSIACLAPLISGAIGSTTRINEEPAAFRSLRAMLGQDHSFGAVLWIGAPWAQGEVGPPDLTQPDGMPLMHGFPPWSQGHPIVDLLGSGETHDPLANFCRSPSEPFCYLNDMFPYLARRLGATYVVAPAGPRVGVLPRGASYTSLDARVSALLGSPSILQGGAASLAVWRLHFETSPVVAAQAIAVVEGTQADTLDALPALQALDLPSWYSLYSRESEPPASLAVDIVPGSSGFYRVGHKNEFALLSQTTNATRVFTVNNQTVSLPLLAASPKLQGWALYGPIALVQGLHAIGGIDQSRVGPLISWSSITRGALDGMSSIEMSPVTVKAERVSITGPPSNFRVLELRRTYDAGWSLLGANQHIQGDGLFNIFFLGGGDRARVFQFSTYALDSISGGLAVLVAIVILVICYALRPRTVPLQAITRAQVEMAEPAFSGAPALRLFSQMLPYLALAGITMLFMAMVLHTLNWFAVPSLEPSLVAMLGPAASDPYGWSETYFAIAIVLLGLTCILKLVLTPFESPRS